MTSCRLTSIVVALKGLAITIEGRITNATPGGSVPGGLLLMLHIYDGMHMADMIHSTADEQGRFRFPQLEIRDRKRCSQFWQLSPNWTTPTKRGLLMKLSTRSAAPRCAMRPWRS